MDLDPPPPYESPTGPSGDVDVDDNVNDSDDSVAGPDWASEHLIEARTALASYHKAKRTLKRQVLEEQEMLRLDMEHHGPPPAHNGQVIVPPWKNSWTVRNSAPTSSIFGPGSIENELDDAIMYGAFGVNIVMPGLPLRADPLRDAFRGVQTMPVRNPSVEWGAMVPRRYFPGVEVEGIIPEMESTPEFVIVKRHVCGTECPEGCPKGGGVRKKGKGRGTVEVGDVEGGEEMEDVVYAHWGADGFDESEGSGSEQERQDKLREEQENETIESLIDCTDLDQHRLKWAAEMGALTYEARIITEKLPSIRINSEKTKEKKEVDVPSLALAQTMAKRVNGKIEKDKRIKQERARLAKIRIANWRARMAGRDPTQMGDEAAEAIFDFLVDSGGLDAPRDDSGEDTPGPAPRSPDKEDSAIDDSPEPSAVTEAPQTSDSVLARPRQGSQPTATSTEEVVSDLAEEETAPREDLPEEIRNLEATPQETAEEESIAKALIAQAAIARDATSIYPTLEETPVLEDAPRETTSEEAAPKGTTSENSTSTGAPHEDTTTEKTIAEEATAQETLGPGPGPSRKRPAPKKSSLKKPPAKRQSIRESPFLDASGREPPSLWILQRDGRLIRNPLAHSQSGPLAGRRWSDPHIDAPVPMPPSDSESRPRSTTITEGMEPPVPRCSAEDTLPSIGAEGQMTEHVEEVGGNSTPPSYVYRPPVPPPTPRLRGRPLAVSEGSPNPLQRWSSDDMFPSIEWLSQAAQRSSLGEASAADVTSLAPARASTPEPPDMSQEDIRSTAQTLETLIEAASEGLEEHLQGFRAVMTNPRLAELAAPHRARRPSALRRETLIDKEALEALESARREVMAEELEESTGFASRVPLPSPPRHNLRSRSRASTENPSSATSAPSVFSGETSGRSSGATSATVPPTGSGDLTAEAAEGGGGERVVEGENLQSSSASVGGDDIPARGRSDGTGSTGTGTDGNMGREASMESEGSIGRERSIGREGSITTGVAETLAGLAVGSVGERVGEEGVVADEGSGVLGGVLPSTEVPEEAVEDEGEGAPLARV
ncbi:hypothetical protein V493_01906 [Pseudogymnoascus sp. VKM F-4281 (FW-2241)]|nr:hypothetical protein V493_01906 [Pseudogymnoascus sp. VKM F-4281 (FW-2241)]